MNPTPEQDMLLILFALSIIIIAIMGAGFALVIQLYFYIMGKRK